MRVKFERDDDDREPPSSNPSGRGTKRPLFLVVAKRNGDVVTSVIPKHSKSAILTAMGGLIDSDASVVTDDLPACKHTGRQQPYLSIKPSERQYARKDDDRSRRFCVIRLESFNGFLGYAMVGVFHFVSSKGLNRFAGGKASRWSRKAEPCLEWMATSIRNGGRRRLPNDILTGAA